MKDNKPRVLFVCPLPPPVHGSSMVSKQICDSKLINEAFRCDFVNNSNSRSMNEIGKFPFAKVGRYFGAYFRMLRLLLTHRYDLVYLAITVNGIGFLKDWPFAFTARLLGRHHVIHQHNKGMDAYADKWPYSWMLRACYKNAKVILLSKRLYPDIEKVVRRDHVMICPNGISNDNPSTGSVQVQNDDDNFNLNSHFNGNKQTHLLYLSNLIESKGVYALLDACKLLKDRGLTLHCDFVGGESKQISRALFDEAVRMRGLADVVTYHGPKYGADKETYWQAADIFVFPTFYYNECFPLVALEAMQHGVPVVTSDEGGIPDIVEDGVTGAVVSAQTIRDHSVNEMLGSSATEEERTKSRAFNPARGTELANRLEQLLKDPQLREQMGRAGYARYQKLFTLEAFEKTMLECLKKSMEESVGGAGSTDLYIERNHQ